VPEIMKFSKVAHISLSEYKEGWYPLYYNYQ